MRSLVVLILLSTAADYGQDHRPTLKETLEWMHTAFPESQSMSAFRFKQTRELNYVDGIRFTRQHLTQKDYDFCQRSLRDSGHGSWLSGHGELTCACRLAFCALTEQCTPRFIGSTKRPRRFNLCLAA